MSERGLQTAQEFLSPEALANFLKADLEFFTVNAKGTAFNEVHPENAKAIPEIVNQLRNHVSVGVCEGC